MEFYVKMHFRRGGVTNFFTKLVWNWTTLRFKHKAVLPTKKACSEITYSPGSVIGPHKKIHI